MQLGPIILDSPMLMEHTRKKTNDNATPVTINEDNIAYSYVGNTPLSLNVKLVVPPYVYKQIEGLSEWKQIYPIVLTELYPDELGVSGWGFISNVQLDEILNPKTHIQISFDVYIIEPDENRCLRMDYTTGVESGTTIPKTYSETTTESKFYDGFDTKFDTTYNWEAPLSYNLTNPNIYWESGKLVLTGSASTNKVPGVVWTSTQDPIMAPFTLDFDMEWLNYANKYNHYFEVALYSGKPTDGNLRSGGKWVGALIDVGSKSAGLTLRKVFDGTYTNLTTRKILSNSEKNPKLRFIVDWNGNLSFYVDSYGNGNYAGYWGGRTGLDISNGVYIVIQFYNYQNVVKYGRISSINAYMNMSTGPANVIPLPPSPPSSLVTPIHSNNDNGWWRLSEEGNIPVYWNYTDDLMFYSSFDNYDLGSVKVFNKNNEAGEYRRVFNDENVFTPTSWYMKNGLSKLFIDATNNQITYQAWVNSSYQTIKQLNLGETIKFVKPYYISPDRCIIQINRTWWHMFRGKHHIMINHPDTWIGYDSDLTHGTAFDHDGHDYEVYHDGNAQISMQNRFYTNLWDIGTGTADDPNPEQKYRFQIIQTAPTNIYAWSIPPTDTSGINWYQHSLDDGTVIPPTWGEGFDTLAREFFYLVDQKITL